MKLHGILVASLALATALALGTVPLPAAADATEPPSRLALSYDGVNWESEPSSPLFSSATLVPGDVLSATVYVRNDARERATLNIVAENVDVRPRAAQSFHSPLTVSVREPGASENVVSFHELEDAVLHESVLEAAQVRALIVEVRLPPTATIGADWDSASFRLRVTLADDVAVISGEPEDSDGADDTDATEGVLPWTGGSAGGIWWAVMAIVLGAGMAIADGRVRAGRKARKCR